MTRQASDTNNNETIKKRPEWREAVAGACAGAVSRTVMAPIERIKLLKQLSSNSTSSVSNTSSSAWNIAKTVYREQGFASFWRGNLPSMVRVSGTAAINFTSMDYYKRVVVAPFLVWCYRSKQQQQRQQQLWTSFLSSGMAGATATTVMYPMEFVRTRLAMDMGAESTTHKTNRRPREYRGMMDVTMKILRSDGIVGIYQGYGIALAGGILYRIILLGGYDALKDELLFRKQSSRDAVLQDEPLSWWERLVSAQFISLTAGTVCYPLDSVRRRMMMQAGQSERLYRNTWHCIRTVFASEGIRGFFLGLGPNMLRSIGGALLLVSYDRVRSWL